MAAVVDEQGSDQGVVAATAAMSPAQRQQAEENLRRLIERLRRSIRPTHG
jgi:tellurite resistance protein